jgi:hypothetical protein
MACERCQLVHHGEIRPIYFDLVMKGRPPGDCFDEDPWGEGPPSYRKWLEWNSREDEPGYKPEDNANNFWKSTPVDGDYLCPACGRFGPENVPCPCEKIREDESNLEPEDPPI